MSLRFIMFLVVVVVVVCGSLRLCVIFFNAGVVVPFSVACFSCIVMLLIFVSRTVCSC